MLYELNNISYTYSDGTPGLAGVSASVKAGDRIAILGANGCGKSTLLRILNGLVHPGRGEIVYQGQPLTEKALLDADFQFSFRQKVGFVFQDADAQLFNATVWDEVAFGPQQLGLPDREVAERVEDILQFLGIVHLSDRAPFRLSGGEKRKVAIASVLSMNPEVLLLDEPVAGLDPKMQSWLIRTLNQLQAAGKTTIVSTHSLHTLPFIADTAWLLAEDHTILRVLPVKEIIEDIELLTKANLIWDGSNIETAVA